jgi:predicted SAM-dependent methyltransferase
MGVGRVDTFLQRGWARLCRITVGDPFWRLHARIAREYLRGRGLEIGALHNPLPLPRSAKASYVDRMSTPDLLSHYPNLRCRKLASIDVVDDGEKLKTIRDGSQDFVVVNHLLEHTQDPIAALGTFFRVLKPGGVLYMSLPDKRYTFDRSRPETPLNHLWEDHLLGPERSRKGHYEEFVAAVEGLTDQTAIRDRAEHFQKNDYSIHFHVWTQGEMLELLLALRARLGFDFELFRKHEHEAIFILRKNGEAKAIELRRAA